MSSSRSCSVAGSGASTIRHSGMLPTRATRSAVVSVVGVVGVVGGASVAVLMEHSGEVIEQQDDDDHPLAWQGGPPGSKQPRRADGALVVLGAGAHVQLAVRVLKRRDRRWPGGS